MYDLHFGVMKGCPYFGWIEEGKQGRGVTFKGGGVRLRLAVYCSLFKFPPDTSHSWICRPGSLIIC